MPTPRGFVCDCLCVANSTQLAARHASAPAYSAAALLTELKFIANDDAQCRACPTVEHFRALTRRRQSLSALRRIAHAHFADDPHCASTDEPVHTCIGSHAWRVIRSATLATDLASLASCEGDGVQHARAVLQRCAANASDTFAHFQLYHELCPYGKTYSSRGHWGLALDDKPPTSRSYDNSCDLALRDLAPSLRRYHSGVLGEMAGAIALGLGAACLGLPEWLSLASWKQDTKAPLPCDQLHALPFGASGGALASSQTTTQAPQSPPKALLYSHWNAHYPKQDVQPSWSALLREELKVSLPYHSHVSRLAVSAEGPGRSAFAGATHPCCSYFVGTQESYRVLGKLHALLLMRIYLQKPDDAEAVITAAGATRPATRSSSNGSPPPAPSHSNTTTSPSHRPWWKERAFPWARTEWAKIEPSRGCWRFEGRAPEAMEKHHYKVPRNEGALSYLGEAGTILYLYLTHELVSLQPPPRVHPGRTREDSSTAACEAGAGRTARHRPLHGLTSLRAIEAAYDRLAAKYTL